MSVPLHLRHAYLSMVIDIQLDDRRWVSASTAPSTLGTPVFVIGAANPSGEVMSDPENTRRSSELHSQLSDLAATVHTAVLLSSNRRQIGPAFAATGISRKQARALGRQYGQEVIFEITDHEMHVVGCDGSWAESRNVNGTAWKPPSESTDTLADAVLGAIGIVVKTNRVRAKAPGWVHEDGVGLHCTECETPLEAFGCERRARNGSAYRAMVLVCPKEARVLWPDQMPDTYRQAATARRRYLLARADADLKGHLDRAYWCYIVELSDDTGEREGPLPWLYVGQTGLTPEERFAQHKAGHRASRWVRRYGQQLRPDMDPLQPVLRTHAESIAYEAWKAAQLRAAGWSIKGGT